MNKKKKGFTLIELIVVIAILGILAAVAVPKLTAFKSDASVSANKATAATIYKAAEAYYSAHDNLTGFTVADYLDANGYDATKLTAAPAVNAAGDGITAVTYGGQTYPN